MFGFFNSDIKRVELMMILTLPASHAHHVKETTKEDQVFL